jgi:UDP-N-acetylglucosamine acyltransferase
MATTIHPTAIIDPQASLGENVEIGPFAFIEKNSRIGDGSRIGSHAHIGENTSIGKNCTVFHGAVLGSIAQDLKYRGEEVWLEIGDNNIFREYCTVNRGTIASGKTVIGNNCAFLSYCHVAHDCVVGDNLIASNNLNLAGHVTIGNNVGFGGVSAVHQFCRVGNFAYIGSYSKVTKDIIPFALMGEDNGDLRIAGINKVGLERSGFDEQRRRKIIQAYRILFKESPTVQEALIRLKEQYPGDEDIGCMISFIKTSERGIIRMKD